MGTDVEGLRALLGMAMKASAVLVRTDRDGRGSGLFAPLERGLTLLGCSHVLGSGEWAVEIPSVTPPATSERDVFERPMRDRKTLLHRVVLAGTVTELDFAFADLAPLGAGEPPLAIDAYLGALKTTPNDELLYAFGAWNRDTLLPGRVLERSASYESHMRFLGEDEHGCYRFGLNGLHQGHDFYRGASGAPIVDERGFVVALLAGGDVKESVLRGVPLARALREAGLAK